jgi:hypothetical protein
MVFFALTHAGYDEFARLLGMNQNLTLWVNTDVLSDVEFSAPSCDGPISDEFHSKQLRSIIRTNAYGWNAERANPSQNCLGSGVVS